MKRHLLALAGTTTLFAGCMVLAFAVAATTLGEFKTALLFVVIAAALGASGVSAVRSSGT